MRVFTIHIPFQGKTYTALVSFKEGLDLSFLVRYLDADTNQLIPEGKIEVGLLEGLKTPIKLSKDTEALIHSTSEAIAGYLHLQTGQIDFIGTTLVPLKYTYLG